MEPKQHNEKRVTTTSAFRLCIILMIFNVITLLLYFPVSFTFHSISLWVQFYTWHDTHMFMAQNVESRGKRYNFCWYKLYSIAQLFLLQYAELF